MTSDDTIAAISSAVGPAPRIIVRMSGPESHAIARQIATELPARDASAGGFAHQTTLRFADLKVPAWAYQFSSPRSYTAQDMIELHIPGNPLVARMLLNDLLARGARLAEPGEFTARAYFTGRIDLTEAEGVAVIISAHSEQEHRAARQLLAGELSRRLRPAMDLLAETLALLEVGIDFSDEDVTFLSPTQVRDRIAQVDLMLRDLADNSARFERLAHEPTFVLLGRPNAGKSTLLNALVGQERAVVSNVAGTTRDVLSAELHLKRGMVLIQDMAGLGDESSATIERQMADRARTAAESADFVLFVHDAADTRPPLDLPRKPDLTIESKSDIASAHTGLGIRVSARTGQGLDALREQLDTLAFGPGPTGATLALNARHLNSIAAARDSLARAAAQSAPEFLALDLRESLESLGQILGQVSPDDLLGRIFATFCIGK